MDDGFKWRKYGKKSVKNSPSPRYIFYRILYIYFVRVSVHLFGSYLHISKRVCVCVNNQELLSLFYRWLFSEEESRKGPQRSELRDHHLRRDSQPRQPGRCVLRNSRQRVRPICCFRVPSHHAKFMIQFEVHIGLVSQEVMDSTKHRAS